MSFLIGRARREELRRRLDEEDIQQALAQEVAGAGDLVRGEEIELYRKAAALTCTKLGLKPDEYYIVTVPEDQTYNSSPVPEGQTRIIVRGEQSSYGSGPDGGVLGVEPLYESLQELRLNEVSK